MQTTILSLFTVLPILFTLASRDEQVILIKISNFNWLRCSVLLLSARFCFALRTRIFSLAHYHRNENILYLTDIKSSENRFPFDRAHDFCSATFPFGALQPRIAKQKRRWKENGCSSNQIISWNAFYHFLYLCIEKIWHNSDHFYFYVGLVAALVDIRCFSTHSGIFMLFFFFLSSFAVVCRTCSRCACIAYIHSTHNIYIFYPCVYRDSWKMLRLPINTCTYVGRFSINRSQNERIGKRRNKNNEWMNEWRCSSS